jgi:hypothetical protein
MRKGYDWLYLFALVLAAAAFCIRLYLWQVRGAPTALWEIIVPGLFVAALGAMWWNSRARRGGSNG